MIRAALLALLATPAMAQDFDALRDMAGGLNDDDELIIQQSAIAACLAGQGDAATTVDIFTAAGWTFTENEPGLTLMSGPNPEVYVLAATDGAFCAAYAEVIGTTPAIGSLQALGKATGLSEEGAPGEMGCFALQLTPTIVAEVTSSGNDPTCNDIDTSSVRITFAN